MNHTLSNLGMEKLNPGFTDPGLKLSAKHQ